MENNINLPYYPYDQNTHPWQPAYDWFFHNTKDKKDVLKLALLVLRDYFGTRRGVVTFPEKLPSLDITPSVEEAYGILVNYCESKKECIGCSFLGVEEKGVCYLKSNLSQTLREFDVEKALSKFSTDVRDSITIKTGESPWISTTLTDKTLPNNTGYAPFVTGTCTAEDLKGTITTTTNDKPITFRTERGGRGNHFYDDYAGDEFHKSLGKKGLKRLKKWSKKNSGTKD